MGGGEVGKIKTFFFPIFIFIILFSFAVAQWSDSLKLHIGVSVGTGYDCVSLSNWDCSDLGSDQQIPGYNNPEGKDIASCSLIEVEWDDLGNVVTLSLILNNVYPGYRADITFDVTNTGTLPVKLYDIVENYSLISNVVNITLVPPTDIELDPGESHKYVLHIEVLQSIRENSTYSFRIELTYTYWANHKKCFKFTSYKSHAFKLNMKYTCISEEGFVSLMNDGSKIVVKFSEFKGGWGWIGLVISNNIGKTVTLSRDNIVVYADDIDDLKTFLYGPFTSVGNSGVWGHISICDMLINTNKDGSPFPDISPSSHINLPSNGKAILWLFIEGDPGPKEIIVELIS